MRRRYLLPVFNHSLLVFEIFLISLLARRGYRIDERRLPGPLQARANGEAEKVKCDVNGVDDSPV